MSAPRWKTFSMLVPVAEVFTVLIVGNLLAGGLLLLLGFDPETMDREPSAATEYLAWAPVASASLVAKFGLILGLAWVLYRWHHREPVRATLTNWAVTSSGRSVGNLLGGGVLLYGFAALPIQLLFLVHEAVPFGEGLPVWGLVEEIGLRPDFLLFILLTSILLPPLLEEPIARGYIRRRLADGYGPMGGVVLSAFVFSLSHGQFLAPDPFLLLVMVCHVFQAVCWAYVVWRTGSLVPAIVAHALINTPIPHTLPVLGCLVAAMVALLLLRRSQLAEWLARFRQDWRDAPAKREIALAALGVALVLVSLVLNRALLVVWLAAFLAVTVLGLWRARRQDVSSM